MLGRAVSSFRSALYGAFGVSGRATIVVTDGVVTQLHPKFDARAGPASLLASL